KGDRSVNGLADQLDRLLVRQRSLAAVVPAHADGGDAFAGAAQGAGGHLATFSAEKPRGGGHTRRGSGRLEEAASVEAIDFHVFLPEFKVDAILNFVAKTMLRVEFRLIHGRRHGRLDEGGREKVIECRARSDLRPQPGPSEFRRGGAGSPQSYRCRC